MNHAKTPDTAGAVAQKWVGTWTEVEQAQLETMLQATSRGIASSGSAKVGATAFSTWRRRSYSSTASTTTAGLPRRATR